MQEIGRMELRNSGGFVARVQFSYMDDEGEKRLSSQSRDVLLGQSLTVSPIELGVPNGTQITMHVFVVWGTDNEARKSFRYKDGISATARYAISGTTLNNELGLVEVTER